MNKQLFNKYSTAVFKTYPLFRQTVYEAFDRQENKLTRTQQIILISLSNAGTLSMSQLAQSINTSNEQATRAVSQLVKSGFIQRHHDDNNRRVVIISLNERSRNYMSNVYSAAALILKEKLSDFSSCEIKKIGDSTVAIGKIISPDNSEK